MTRKSPLPAFVVLLVLSSFQLRADYDEYDVTKLADGVYALIWREVPVNPLPNVLIVINDDDVFVVDTSEFPSSAATIVKEIRKLTSKPVRYVVNTHWHDDHIFGNFVLQQAWPGVEFIAHPNTRNDAHLQAFGKMTQTTDNARTQLETYRKILESGKRSDGSPLSDDSRKQVEYLIHWFTRYVAEIPTVHEVLPGLTFENSIDLYRGSRLIQIRFLGRANTRGDVVVYLPNEKILATGDIVTAPVPFGFGSYYREWAATLDKLMAFDATTIFLSHGPVQHDFSYLHTLHDLLSDLVSRVDAEVARGATLEETKKAVTLDDWKKKLGGDDKVIPLAFQEFFVDPAVERAWHQAKGEPDDQDRK